MHPFVRARAFFPLLATISASVAGAHVARADDNDDDVDDRRRGKQEVSEADEARFQAFVREGARASDAGRLNDVVRAYGRALDIRRDPLIMGRLGVTLAMFNDSRAHVAAAHQLYQAITEHAGVSYAERKGFWEAFDLVQTKICRIEIITNDVNSVVQMDDDKPIKSYGSFWEFVEPGKHEIIGKLKDGGEVRHSIECSMGKRIEVYLDFEHKDAPVKTIEKVHDRVVFVDVPPKAQEPSNSPSDPTIRRLNIWFGPAIVFGAAPSPAYGISLSGAYKFGNWSPMIGARGAYAFGPIAGNPLDVFEFSGIAGPCFREKWFMACGFASMNIIKWIPTASTSDKFDIDPQITPGIGIGVGGRFYNAKNYGFFVNADATMLAHSVELVIPRLYGFTPVWKGNQLLASISLGVEFDR